MRPQPLTVGDIGFRHGAGVDPAPVVDLGQHLVLLPQCQVQLLAQDSGVEQVLHPDAGPRRLVCVGGTDATPGGADPGFAEIAFCHFVECAMVRHDQVRVGGDEQPLTGDPTFGEAFHLREQDLGIDHHPVADDRRDMRGEHPGGQHVQGVGFVTDDHRVAGVVAALVPDHVVDEVTEQVGCLTLALVAPLCAHHHNGRHM